MINNKSILFSTGSIKTCFNDVKGCEEVKEEIRHVVEFLKNPNCNKFGGKLPRGVLMKGPPGSGKTLMAKALAGEAKVDFFYAAGSEIDGYWIGEGAKKIQKLFREARESAPSVIFIDEIDSIGKF
jgi:ATP-dependent metalloprotease